MSSKTTKTYGFSLRPEIMEKIDRVRGNVSRSAVVDLCLGYLSEDYIKSIISTKRTFSYDEYRKQQEQQQPTPEPTLTPEVKTEIMPSQEALEKAKQEAERLAEDQKLADQSPLKVVGHEVPIL